MKIAVTGHTSGIGKAIAERFTAEGHTVTGFSRATGHDLTDPNMPFKIAGEAAGHDVFVNSAYSRQVGFAQTTLLYAVRDIWQSNPSKTIINVSSVASDGIALKREIYCIHKAALDKACEQLSRVSYCRVINIKPGYVDTPMIEKFPDVSKMPPEDIAEACVWMLSQPKHLVVSVITILARDETGLVSSFTKRKL
jgi:NADP-dependent 3-hydroxy acid dehydrogenase YdfG